MRRDGKRVGEELMSFAMFGELKLNEFSGFATLVRSTVDNDAVEQ